MLFLTSAEAAQRMRAALLGSITLWLGALTTWLMHADTAVLHWISASPLFASLQPLFVFYSNWGLFIFYVLFIALLAQGMLRKQRLLKLVGLSYIYAQALGTVLLVHLIKMGCGRPRPHFSSGYEGFCPAPSLSVAFHSFPSSHSADMAVGAIFVLILFRSRVAGMLALSLALGMALARIAIEKHYLSDVLAGMALGVTIAGVAWHVFLHPRWKNFEKDAMQ